MKNAAEPIIASICTRLLAKSINHKYWWHVPPIDPKAYTKRSKFYSSSFDEAKFYDRPGDPERVTVMRTLAGDEEYIETVLLGKYPTVDSEKLHGEGAKVAVRFALDARMKKAVKAGYDSFALMTPRAWSRSQEVGQLPRTTEPNVFA